VSDCVYKSWWSLPRTDTLFSVSQVLYVSAGFAWELSFRRNTKRTAQPSIGEHWTDSTVQFSRTYCYEVCTHLFSASYHLSLLPHFSAIHPFAHFPFSSFKFIHFLFTPFIPSLSSLPPLYPLLLFFSCLSSLPLVHPWLMTFSRLVCVM